MLLLRLIGGLLALFLTLLGFGLLIGPILPFPPGTGLPTASPWLNAALGLASLAGAVAVWIWACKERGTKK